MNNVDMSDFAFITETLAKINDEVNRHQTLWGTQKHPVVLMPYTSHVVATSSPNPYGYGLMADKLKAVNGARSALGCLAWDAILREEVYEALSASTEDDMIEELVQVAAVAVSMIRSIQDYGLGGAA